MQEKIKITFAIISLIIISACTSSQTNNQNQPKAQITKSPQKINHIQNLAATCFNCHSPQGKSNTIIPTIAGQTEKDLITKMQTYKTLPNTTDVQTITVMPRLMKGYTDEQITQLAQYFSQIK